MDSISWLETVQATVSSCLPCLHRGSPPDDDDNTGNRPPGHLRSLLAHNGSNTSLGDETLSLHSAPGDSRRRRKKNKKNKKNITFFGFDLFGKRQPPIHLSDDEDDPLVRRHQRISTSSASTNSSDPYMFDSDAAPLDSAVINRFTAEEIASRVRAAQAAEEEERLAKEERRRKRRERKELKRLAGTLADGEFEGFQGSGGGVPYKAIPSPLLKLANGDGSSADGSQSSTNGHPRPTADPEDADEADLDGVVYARGTRAGSASGSHSGGRSNSNSDSRTTSSLNPIPYPAAGETLLAPAPPKKTKTKTKSSKRSQSSSNTRSSGSTQSPSSIGSPVANSFQAAESTRAKIDPTFEGVDFGDIPPPQNHAPRIQDFPSTGLGVRRNSSANSGAFLARISDD